MRQAHRSILLVASLLATGILPWTATAAGPTAPQGEALQNPSLEGSAGYELQYGAQTSPLARSGTQAIDLAPAGAAPQPDGELGALSAYPAMPAPLAAIASISFWSQAPSPGGASLQARLLMVDADGAPLACLSAAPIALVARGTYVQTVYDLASSWTVAGPDCAGGATATLSGFLAAQPDATLRALRIESLAPGAPARPAGEPILVDDLSVATAAVRVVPAASETCGRLAHVDIGDGIACAAPGATVLVEPGVHAGFDISRSITVCATHVAGMACEDGRTDVVVDGPAARTRLVSITAPDATLRGFVLQNPNLTATDSATARVEAALVVVQADRVRVAQNQLRNLGAQPAPLASRASSIGIDVVSGDAVRLEDDRISGIAPARGADGTCVHAPCADIGVRASHDATRLVIDGGPIDLTASGSPAYGMDIASDGARITGIIAKVLANASTAPVTSAAFVLHADDVRLSTTIIQSTSRTAAPAGILGAGRGFVLENTTFLSMERGIDLALSGPALLYQTIFSGTDRPIHLVGGSPSLIGNYVVSGASTAVDLDAPQWTEAHANLLRASVATLHLSSATHDLAIDARQNDWGTYSRAGILASIHDDGARDTLDVRCYVGTRPTDRICPPTAGFTLAGSTWGRPISFDDASTSGGRAITRWDWTFSDGATASGASVQHAFGAPGTATARLDITDADGWTATTTRAFLVTDAAPVLMPVGDRVVAENSTLTLRLAAADPDGDAVTFAAAGLPAGATLNATSGVFSWRPDFTQEGTYAPVTFSATDGFLTDTENITIAVGHTNAPPTLTIQGALVAREGASLRFLVRANDVDGDPVQLYAGALPLNAAFTDYGNGTALFSWSIDYFQAGDYTLHLEAEDAMDLTENDVDLHVIDVDRAPVFDPIAPTTSPETVPIQLQVTATDPDGDSLAYSARHLPSGATFDAPARVLRWTPDYTQAGHWPIQFVVNDGNLTTILDYTLVVTDVDRAPTLAPLADATARAATTLRIPLVASDPDGTDVLSFSSSDAPTGVSFSGATLVWSTTAQQAGSHTMHVTVSDGTLSATRSLNVTLTPNAAPVVNLSVPARVEAGAPIRLSAWGSKDPDGDSSKISYQWDFDATDGITTQANGANATWQFLRLGNTTVTLRATDMDGVTTVTNATVLVDDALQLGISLFIPGRGTGFGIASLADVPLGPVAHATIAITLSWQPLAGGPKYPMAAFNATTGANGAATFTLPHDLVVQDLPGTHVVDATARLATSYLGDEETASASASYSPSMLV